MIVQRLIKAMHENDCLKGGGDSDDHCKNGKNGDNNVDGHEAELIRADKPVGQNCYACGKGGHWAKACPERQKNDRKRNCFDGTRHECSAYGHKNADQWELSTHAHKRGQTWVSRKKRVQVVSTPIEDDMANEMFLANIDFGEINICKENKDMDLFN